MLSWLGAPTVSDQRQVHEHRFGDRTIRRVGRSKAGECLDGSDGREVTATPKSSIDKQMNSMNTLHRFTAESRSPSCYGKSRYQLQTIRRVCSTSCITRPGRVRRRDGRAASAANARSKGLLPLCLTPNDSRRRHSKHRRLWRQTEDAEPGDKNSTSSWLGLSDRTFQLARLGAKPPLVDLPLALARGPWIAATSFGFWSTWLSTAALLALQRLLSHHQCRRRPSTVPSTSSK